MGPAMTWRRLIVHVGRHKTGSTAIQQALAAARPALAAAGVLYPRLPDLGTGALGDGSKIAQHALAHALNPRKGPPDNMRRLLREIARARRAAPGTDTLLISSEAFQQVGDLRRVRRFVDKLDVDRVDIVCYVREHLDYALSAYRQMIQAQSRFVPFAAYCRQRRDMSDFIARWSALGTLHLDWYDAAMARHGDIVADFLAVAGLDPAGTAPTGRRHNPSIGGNLLALKMLANRDGRPFADFATMGRLAGTDPAFARPFRVPADLAAALRADSAYNASLAAHIGPPALKSWERGPDLPDPDRLDDDIARLRAAAAAAKTPPDLAWLDDLVPPPPGFYL